jgi:exopolyphosphatase / guanosine-5'-triphosphate,3'-diphosphate pyrophosphatase
MEQPKASIDLGTNSARLLIGVAGNRHAIRPLVVKRVVTRLGGGFTRENGLSRQACERSLAVMREFADDIERYGVETVRAVATSAVRDAVNGGAFADEVLRKTGIRLEIIDGREEALFTLRGVVSGLADNGDYLVFDIGGGSTEFTLARGENLLFTRSLPLGVVRLTEGKITVEAMAEKICRELNTLRNEMESTGAGTISSGVTLVGTAGTVTTLAAVDLNMADYDYSRVQGHILSLSAIRGIYRSLLPLTPDQRLLVPGVEKGREDLIIAGALIVIKTMELFRFEECTVSDAGLLEGLLIGL